MKPLPAKPPISSKYQLLKKERVHVGQHLHEFLALDEVDVGSTPYKRIQTHFCNAEVDVETDNPVGLQGPQDVLQHLGVEPSGRRVLLSAVGHLQPGRFERGILVLVAGEEHHVPEVGQPSLPRQFQEEQAALVGRVVHGQLLEAHGVPHLGGKPQPSLENRVARVHVAEVWRRERHVGVEVRPELQGQQGQRGARDEPAHGVADEG
mmetsp:Transcript_24052/g.62725  ORF Transcript_24052/g.62725 Transcript_24052/m.62725 type:complete len:207 (-) Transcript_24052:229-849(-)